MKRSSIRTLCATVFGTAVAVALAWALPAPAQFANSDLVGTVKDVQGGPLPGVLVTARNQATGIDRSTASAANGSFALFGLPPGTYNASFELEGFKSREETGIELRVGQEARLAVTLELGTVEEQLTVVGTAPLIELTSKEIGGTLTAREFEDLPTQNRSFALFAALLPGITPVPSTESTSADAIFANGQDDNNNAFNVDGANNASTKTPRREQQNLLGTRGRLLHRVQNARGHNIPTV